MTVIDFPIERLQKRWLEPNEIKTENDISVSDWYRLQTEALADFILENSEKMNDKILKQINVVYHLTAEADLKHRQLADALERLREMV